MDVKVTFKTKKESAITETKTEDKENQNTQGIDDLENELRGFEDLFN